MMRSRVMAMAGLLACISFASAAQPRTLQVSAEGAVQRAGTLQLPEGSRFDDAVVAAMPRRDAYALGASVFRREELARQLRLRAGLLHDLESLATATDAPHAVAARARTLHAWVSALPATGRLPLEGNPRRLEASKGDRNRLLADGDRFHFPKRPATVTIVGAVLQPCAVAHVPLRDAADYLRDCTVDGEAANRDVIHVVQPDGSIHELGIALWNRSEPLALAPGAIVYVPLRARATEKFAPELDGAMTAFLATLPLPHDGLVKP